MGTETYTSNDNEINKTIYNTSFGTQLRDFMQRIKDIRDDINELR